MKTQHIIALAALLSLPAHAAVGAASTVAAAAQSSADSSSNSSSHAGEIPEGINMFSSGEDDYKLKRIADEKYGCQWAVDLAYGYWATGKAAPQAPHKNHYALLHAQLNQRLLEDEANGGTWLRGELSASWALDRRSNRQEGTFVDYYGSANDVHGDIFGQHNAFIPELALMQYFNGKRACIIAGMINLTNYFDAVGIANDSFCSFTNTGFMNSALLPLSDSNLGGLVQLELGEKDYLMAAASRSGCEMGYNPFHTRGSAYSIVGEWGHIAMDGQLTTRLNPFFLCTDEKDERGRAHKAAGLVGSVEYSPNSRLLLYSRAGYAAPQSYSATAEFSVGANVRLLPSREDDFLGIAWGVFKAQNHANAPTIHSREQTLELMYSCQLTPYLKVVPHLQYIHDPAYRETRDAVLYGIQSVLSF